MFSVRQKREIAEKVQQILRETAHPELPEGEIRFSLDVRGKEEWSWACIKNNGAVSNPDFNPHNERQDRDQADDVEQNSEEGKGLVMRVSFKVPAEDVRVEYLFDGKSSTRPVAFGEVFSQLGFVATGDDSDSVVYRPEPGV